MIERREFLQAAAAMTVLLAGGAMAGPQTHRRDITPALRALESVHARLGVCLLDTASGACTGHRVDEHFALCSTFKLALVAACLREADAGRLDLDEQIAYTEGDLLPWAPVTREHLGKGQLSIARLAEAAQTISDGTAANLLVRRLGGPAAVTAKFREMGDPVTRLDRYEPMLTMVLSADLRDTTTPSAMAQLLARLSTGDLLSAASRERLLGWMYATRTGARRLRAGLPADWRVGNKTGTGRDVGTTNKCNDIAIVHPLGKAPIIVCAYYDSGEYTDQIEPRHEAVLAEVGRIAAEWALS
jgi:beta-lactamase class A